MKIEATWSKPVPLKKCLPGGLIYELDLTALPTEASVYIFGRKFGNKVVPIYIGETVSLRARINNHLKSLPLMRAIENAPSGERFLIYCTFKTGSKDKVKKHLKIVEKALIFHTQTEGHELFNKKGTKLPTDSISFTGNRTSEALSPRVMLVKQALTNSKKKGSNHSVKRRA